MTQIDSTSPPDPTHTDDVAALEHIVRLCRQGQDAHIGLVPALNPTYGVDGPSVQHTALRLALALYHQHLPHLTTPATRPITAMQVVQSVDSSQFAFRFNQQVRGDVVWYQRPDGAWVYWWRLPDAEMQRSIHLTVFFGADNTSIVCGDRRSHFITLAAASNPRLRTRLRTMIEGACKIQQGNGEIAEVQRRLGDDYQRVLAAEAALALPTSLDPERFAYDVWGGMHDSANGEGDSLRTILRGSKRGLPVSLYAPIGESDDGEVTTHEDTLAEDDAGFDAVLDCLDTTTLRDLIAPYLDMLTPGQREAFQHADAASQAGLSVEAYCADAGLPYDPIKQRLRRARKALTNVPLRAA